MGAGWGRYQTVGFMGLSGGFRQAATRILHRAQSHRFGLCTRSGGDWMEQHGAGRTGASLHETIDLEILPRNSRSRSWPLPAGRDVSGTIGTGIQVPRFPPAMGRSANEPRAKAPEATRLRTAHAAGTVTLPGGHYRNPRRPHISGGLKFEHTDRQAKQQNRYSILYEKPSVQNEKPGIN